MYKIYHYCNVQLVCLILLAFSSHTKGADIYTICAKELIDGKQSNVTCILNMTTLNACVLTSRVTFFWKLGSDLSEEYCSTTFKPCPSAGSGLGNCSCVGLNATAVTASMTFGARRATQEKGEFFCEIFCPTIAYSKGNLNCNPIVFEKSGGESDFKSHTLLICLALFTIPFTRAYF